MPRTLDMSFESPATVEQVHSAFGTQDYWLARLAAFGGAKTLDSLLVDCRRHGNRDCHRGPSPRWAAQNARHVVSR